MKTVIIDHCGQDLLVENCWSDPFVHDLAESSEDKIARGRALAADSSYPPFSICEEIANTLLQS